MAAAASTNSKKPVKKSSRVENGSPVKITIYVRPYAPGYTKTAKQWVDLLTDYTLPENASEWTIEATHVTEDEIQEALNG